MLVHLAVGASDADEAREGGSMSALTRTEPSTPPGLRVALAWAPKTAGDFSLDHCAPG
jgi:hypothetical protein